MQEVAGIRRRAHFFGSTRIFEYVSSRVSRQCVCEQYHAEHEPTVIGALLRRGTITTSEIAIGILETTQEAAEATAGEKSLLIVTTIVLGHTADGTSVDTADLTKAGNKSADSSEGDMTCVSSRVHRYT